MVWVFYPLVAFQVLPFLLFFFIASNQNYAKVDTESWSSIGFGKKLSHSFKLDLEQSLRLKDDISSFKQTFTEGSISYNIFNRMKVFIPIRYAVHINKFCICC